MLFDRLIDRTPPPTDDDRLAFARILEHCSFCMHLGRGPDADSLIQRAKSIRPARADQQPATEYADDHESTRSVWHILAAADAIDGNADQVIAQCPNCAFGLDGSAKHVLTYGTYSIYFCSRDCLQAFEADTHSMILAMKVPKSN